MMMKMYSFFFSILFYCFFSFLILKVVAVRFVALRNFRLEEVKLKRKIKYI